MLGLMQDRPLLISSLIEFAALNHGNEEIVSRTVEGPIHRYNYKDCAIRSRQLAKALDKLGVEQSDRIATLAWNGYRHVEIYYGVSGMGTVCHTINPRLFPEQIIYIINHAEDKYIFMDLTFVPLIEAIVEHIPKENNKKFTSMKRTVIGGAAAPRAMIEIFEKNYNVNVIHAWGMTEMSPLGTACNLKKKHAGLSLDEKIDLSLKQGRAVYGVDMKIVDGTGKKLPWDGKAFGNLLVRGPWITSGYFKDDVIDHLRGSLAKWQLPDDVIFVDELPHTATGKILKTKLRTEYKDHILPTVTD